MNASLVQSSPEEKKKVTGKLEDTLYCAKVVNIIMMMIIINTNMVIIINIIIIVNMIIIINIIIIITMIITNIKRETDLMPPCTNIILSFI